MSGAEQHAWAWIEGPAPRSALRVLGRLAMGASSETAADWDVLATLARRQGVAPLLFWRLVRGRQSDSKTALPEAVREALRRDFFVSAARAMAAEHQLSRVLRALAEARVPAVVVKGAAAGAFYPDPALRAYGDLDLLVPLAQVKQAEAALNGLGYCCSKPAAWWLEHGHHLPPMICGGNRLAVEIHWRLDSEELPGRLPVEDLWARVEPWSVKGQPALRLEAVDAVLHLCLHAVVHHHAHVNLRALCDVAQVVAEWKRSEWDALTQRALNYGLARPVYLMLILLDQALGLAAPPDVMEALRPPGAPLPDDLAERLLAPAGEASPVPMAVVQARAKETPAARVRHLLWHLFLPRDGMAVVYGIPADSPRIWLAYLYRPFDLLRRYGRGMWDALRGRRAAWEREVWLERWVREQ